MRKSSPIWFDPERTSKSKHKVKEESRARGCTPRLTHDKPHLLSSTQLKCKKENHFKARFMKQEKKGERQWQQVTNYSLQEKSVKPITLWGGTLRSRHHGCHCILIGENNWTKLIWRLLGLCPLMLAFSGGLSLNFPGTIKQKKGLSMSHI